MFKNKTVLITGASRGIGRHLAREFAERGASLILVSRDMLKLQETQGLLPDGTKCDLVQCDLTIKTDREALVPYLANTDILINNAGKAFKDTVCNTDISVLQELFAVNVASVFCLSKSFAQQKKEQGKGGNIVNISSISGLRAGYGRLAYGVSKGALQQLTAQLAIELAKDNIWVNAVAPGPVDTDMVKLMVSPEAEAKYLSRNPAGRYASLNEVSEVVMFFARITGVAGQTIAVDGGFTALGFEPS